MKHIFRKNELFFIFDQDSRRIQKKSFKKVKKSKENLSKFMTATRKMIKYPSNNNEMKYRLSFPFFEFWSNDLNFLLN
jgi:hypothetical protein